MMSDKTECLVAAARDYASRIGYDQLPIMVRTVLADLAAAVPRLEGRIVALQGALTTTDLEIVRERYEIARVTIKNALLADDRAEADAK